MQQEREAGLRNADTAVGTPVDEPARDEDVLDALVRASAAVARAGGFVADGGDDKVQDVVPAPACVAVEEGHVNLGRHAQRRGHAKGVVVAAAGEGEAHRGAKVGRELHFLRLVLGGCGYLHNV